MKVWIFQSGEPLPVDGADVRPMRAINLTNVLVEAGHEVILWSSCFSHQKKKHRCTEFSKIEVTDGLTVNLIPSLGYHRNIGFMRLLDHGQLAFRLRYMLSREDSMPDVLFIGYPPIETAYVLANWCEKNSVPFLLDVKDQWPSMFLYSLPHWLKSIGYLVLYPYFFMARKTMRKASGLSAMADSFLDWAVDFTGRQRNQFDAVFPLTSPAANISEEQMRNAEKQAGALGLSSDETIFRVLFVGTFMSVFDFAPIKAVAERFLNEGVGCEFVLCGAGGSFDKYHKQMGHLPNIFFPGWVDRPFVEAVAKKSQVFIAPYKNNDDFIRSIPNKVIDALSLGLPVLCPLDGEVALIIDTYDVGSRYSSSPENAADSLYEKLVYMMNYSDVRERKALAAKNLHADKFSFEGVYGDLKEHLALMCDNY